MARNMHVKQEQEFYPCVIILQGREVFIFPGHNNIVIVQGNFMIKHFNVFRMVHT